MSKSSEVNIIFVSDSEYSINCLLKLILFTKLAFVGFYIDLQFGFDYQKCVLQIIKIA